MQEEFRPLVGDLVTVAQEKLGGNLVSMVLYGSVARGGASKNSDVDVCLVCRKLPKSHLERSRLFRSIREELRKRRSYLKLRDKGYLAEISPMFFTAEEIQNTKPIFLDMVDDGEILTDDGTLQNKLDQVRRRMRELGSKKIYLDDGSWFWQLKPDIKLGEVLIL